MGKSNKELAIDVAIAVIESNPRLIKGINNNELVPGITLDSICNVIKGVSDTLDKIDQNTK